MVNGTLINYYFHCKRQCFLTGNRLDFEDNSELVKIGKAIHEAKAIGKNNTEIKIDNIIVDKITKDYLVEVKKSDADVDASRWQLLYYLQVLKKKGLIKKGKLEFVEKNKTDNKIVIVELTEELEEKLNEYIRRIEKLIVSESIPPVIEEQGCRKCAYYEYCYI